MEKKKVVIRIEEVVRLQSRRRRINQYNLHDILWTKNGKQIQFPKDVLDDWDFTGLTNIDFIMAYGAKKENAQGKIKD